ncbi:MAG: YnfA family protein [Candidatus Nitrosocosmicus sp.]|nr:YnfA family protein [Candidatus Nitrosocosmicus sp.]MDN5867194.1 YnfA family protein [Candidatus Nitrosocosmicus sp.]
MELILQTDYSVALVASTFSLFVIAALLEIGGGYLVWLWLREKKRMSFGLIGGVILFIYGIIPTLQPSNFGRVYAAYGGIFVVMAIIWGLIIDKKRPDRYEIIGGTIVLIGAAVIFYAPR